MPYSSVRRATGFTATTADRLGLLADALEALQGAGVNLIQATGAGAGGTAYLFVVSDQADAIKQIAASAGVAVEEYPVLVFEGDDQPGALVDIARKLSDAGINIKYCSAAAAAGKYCAVFFLTPDTIDRAAALFGL